MMRKDAVPRILGHPCREASTGAQYCMTTIRFYRSSSAQSLLLHLYSSSHASGAGFLVSGGSWGWHGFEI